jgi:hypothetical protein
MVIRYRSPSALWVIDRVLVLTGLGFVIASLNVAIGAFRTEFRDEFRLWRHLLVPVTAAVLFLFLVRDPPSVCDLGTCRKQKRRRVCQTKAIVDHEAVVS